MDTPIKEQQIFQNVTSLIAASEDEVTEPNTLSLDFINYVCKFRSGPSEPGIFIIILYLICRYSHSHV